MLQKLPVKPTKANGYILLLGFEQDRDTLVVPNFIPSQQYINKFYSKTKEGCQ